MKHAAPLLALLLVSVPAPAEERVYRIGLRDGLSIHVFEVPDLNVEREVRADGTIDLPLLGTVVAAGMTEIELAASLEAALEASYLQRASVTVDVTDVRSRPIRVVGAVATPGDLDDTGPLRLLDVLTAAGGLARDRGGVLTVLRTAQNGLGAQLEIRIDDLLSGAHELWNIPIFPDDVINVPLERPKTIYSLGELVTKGALEFQSEERVTLLIAIARAGGLSERASNRVVVKRPGPDGSFVEIEASYKQILNGKEPDIELQDGDLILVKRSLL